MVLRVLLFGFLLLGLAGLGGLAYMSMRQAPPERAAAPPPVPRVVILAAARPLRAGGLLKPEDLAPLQLEVGTEPAGSRPDTRAVRAELFGAMVRRSLLPGEPILADDVLRPGDHGFLAAVLGPDMRAVTIGVDVVSGIAGLIWPGDRVDILLTQTLDAGGIPARRVAGETVLQDIRVIAIDQSIVQGATGEAAEAGRNVRTVTIEVTPRQAERVAVATRLGRLSLVVRSASRTPPGAEPLGPDSEPAVTWGGDVSPALRGPTPNGAQPTTLRVYQGASKQEEYRF